MERVITHGVKNASASLINPAQVVPHEDFPSPVQYPSQSHTERKPPSELCQQFDGRRMSSGGGR